VTLPTDLRAFRVMSIVTGIGLLMLVLVAVPLRYLGDRPTFSMTYSPIHGAIYMVYVGVVVWVTSRRGWSPLRAVLVVVAGAIPFASFFVERKVIAQERARLVAAERAEGGTAP
jgi:integral membrane protein